MNASTLSTLGFGAAAAGIMAGWEQVKSIFNRILGLLIVTVEFDSGYAGAAARIYCNKMLTPSPTAFRNYTGRMQFIKPKTRHGCVLYDQIGSNGRLFWKGLTPIWVSIVSKKDNDSPTESAGPLTLRFVRGTLDADKIAFEAAGMLVPDGTDITLDRFRVVRRAGRSGKLQNSNSAGTVMPKSNRAVGSMDVPAGGRVIGWKEEDIGEASPKSSPIDRLSLTEDVETVVQEIKRWFESKKWYEERQIPWRFGALFHGKPGTGKSSLTKAIGQELKIPIYFLDISTMDNEEFHDAYHEALSDAPCIVLIEDIDAVFDGRENVAAERGKGLTFDCLLNTISGVETTDGVLLVVTTNNLDKVDHALGLPQAGSTSSRPGRIDRAVELPALDTVGRTKLAKRILGGCHESWVDYLVEIGENDTGAQFEDRCASAALNLYWSQDPKSPAPALRRVG